MPLGSKKFIGGGKIFTNLSTVSSSGTSLSGISMETGYYKMSGFSGDDTAGNIYSIIDNPSSNVNASSITLLTAGRTLTIEITSLQVKFRTTNSPDVNRTCYVKLRYGRLINLFSESDHDSNVSNIATFTSTAASTYTVSGATYTHTNDFGSYLVDIGSTSWTSSVYPVPFFYRKTISATDANDAGAGTSPIGLIATYSVSSGGQRVDGSMGITIREG
jgi:hypothetical protein